MQLRRVVVALALAAGTAFTLPTRRHAMQPLRAAEEVCGECDPMSPFSDGCRPCADGRSVFVGDTKVTSKTLRDIDVVSASGNRVRLATDDLGAASCLSGATIPHSNRSAPGSACVGTIGVECSYRCDEGYLAIGRHACQTYAQGDTVYIDQAYFGGRCDRLCPATAAPCPAGQVPSRVNSSDAAPTGGCAIRDIGAPILLASLPRGEAFVWRRGRRCVQ